MTIKEVCEKYDLTPDTLRYYERVGVIPEVNRTKGGIRDYTEEDEKWVANAVCMRSAGAPVEMLVEYVKLLVTSYDVSSQKWINLYKTAWIMGLRESRLIYILL